jgi:CHAT domain-containing protein
VASRWGVDSNVTRQLMRVFYANLTSGKPPAESLRAARAAIRNTPSYQHPYYWASFAVFGSS